MLYRILFTILFIYSTAQGALKITWFGTTTFNISDGKTAIFFDPFVTRPSLWSIISFSDEKSNIFHVKRWLNKIDKKNIKGIFVSHTHYDHALDLNNFQRETGAMVFGSYSAKNILLGGAIDSKHFTYSKVGESFKVGDFKVSVLSGEHPSHFLGMTFWTGDIEAPIKENSPLYKYKQGEVFNYFIEHPSGNIFFHPSGQVTLKEEKLSKMKSKILIQGIANRESSEALIDSVLVPVGASVVIPAHHDDFFKSLEDGFHEMTLVDPQEFKETLKKSKSSINYVEMKYGETLTFQ